MKDEQELIETIFATRKRERTAKIISIMVKDVAVMFISSDINTNIDHREILQKSMIDTI